jgi:hypothetical protein
MAKKPEHVEAIFDYSENVPQLLSDAITFYTAIAPAGAISAGSLAGAGATYAAIPVASITTALAHVASCRTAESAAATRAIGTAPARDLALAPVLVDIHNFVATIQIVVNNAPNAETAKAIVAACGLHTRKETPRTKAGFDVKNDPTSVGMLDFAFKAALRGVRACYEIQQSTDNINWITIKITPESRTTYMHGMPSGTKLYFRGHIILGDKNGGVQAWLTPATAFLYVL